MGSSYMHVEWHIHAQSYNINAYIGITIMLLNALDTPPPSLTYSLHRHIAYHERNECSTRISSIKSRAAPP